jgi:hypothetical protein
LENVLMSLVALFGLPGRVSLAHVARRAARPFTCGAAVALVLCLAAGPAAADDKPVETAQSGRRAEAVQQFKCIEAGQGAAVDDTHFYAITNRRIGKYEKGTGKLVAQWKDAKDGPLRHMNAGVVVDGKLYCAHSTWPVQPWVSSVEIWDASTLTHIGSHSFGDYGGALNWVDWHDGHWWAVFVYYSRKEGPEHVRRTRLVKFDSQWRQLASWAFPTELLQRFAPSSNSGGSFGPDGLLYCTGHDRYEIYALRIPKSGSILEWVDTLPAPFAGQAFVWDRSQPGTLYGIAKGHVVEAKIVELGQ